MNAGVFIRSILHLKPSMVYWRVHRAMKSAALSVAEKSGLAKYAFKPSEPPAQRDLPPLSSVYHSEAIDLGRGMFTFLNASVELPASTGERRALVARQPLLWQFHFGYHDFLLALLHGNEDDEALRGEVLDFMRRWIDDYPLHAPNARRSAWHAYVLSLRIESWIRLARHFPGEGFIPMHIYQMARVLQKNLEFGTMANHLMKNIKALVLAGLYFEGAPGRVFLDNGMKLLDRELREQILDDGMHFERTPMYHVAMTSDVLDLLEALGTAAPDILTSSAEAMTAFLGRIIHPDGEVPFFNDSTSSFFLKTPEVLQRGLTLCGTQPSGEPPALTSSEPDKISGLMVHRSAGFHLVFDGGNVGPDYQPGHAHCDTLSFELSVQGSRFITDTGVFHYRESPERTWSRSTAAHNTLSIDSREQSEIWKSFRVGRRAKAVSIGEVRMDALTVFHAAHDGYEHLAQGMLHERFVVVSDSEWLAIIDIVHGALSHSIESNLHLAPGTDAETTDYGLDLRLGSLAAQLHTNGFYSAIPPRLFTTEYYPAFGKKLPRNSIRWAGLQTLPAIGGYLIHFGGERPRIEYSTNPPHFRILNASGMLYESSSGLS